jgi:hypothetical protein
MQTAAMSHNPRGSTTSLDKTEDKSHLEDGGVGGTQNRPDALKDMSETEILALEKKMVRKMDSIIL